MILTVCLRFAFWFWFWPKFHYSPLTISHTLASLLKAPLLSVLSVFFWQLKLISAHHSEEILYAPGKKSPFFNFKWAVMASAAFSQIQYGLASCKHARTFQFPRAKVWVLSADSFPGLKWQNEKCGLTHLTFCELRAAHSSFTSRQSSNRERRRVLSPIQKLTLFDMMI